MDMKEVENSSNITAYGYENGVLVVRFKGGAEYVHDNVPEDVARSFEGAGSKGSFYHAFIKGAYKGVRRE